MYSLLVTTILNNNVIPDFDEVLSRHTQEETRMMEYENEGNAAFTARAKKKNNGGQRTHGRAGDQGKKGRCYTCNKTGHYARECPNRRDSHWDDDNKNKKNGNQRNNRFKGKRKAPSGHNGNGQPFKRSRNPSMRNLILLMIRKINSFLYQPSLLHLHPTLWMFG